MPAPRGRPCIQYAIIQAVVTLALLGFAYAVYATGGENLAAVIATAAATHWLKESAPLGRTVRTVGEFEADRADLDRRTAAERTRLAAQP